MDTTHHGYKPTRLDGSLDAALRRLPNPTPRPPLCGEGGCALPAGHDRRAGTPHYVIPGHGVRTSSVTVMCVSARSSSRTALYGSRTALSAASFTFALCPNDYAPRGQVHTLAGGIITGHTLTLNALVHAGDPHAELDALLEWVTDTIEDDRRVVKWTRRRRDADIHFAREAARV